MTQKISAEWLVKKTCIADYEVCDFIKTFGHEMEIVPANAKKIVRRSCRGGVIEFLVDNFINSKKRCSPILHYLVETVPNVSFEQAKRRTLQIYDKLDPYGMTEQLLYSLPQNRFCVAFYEIIKNSGIKTTM